MDNITDYINKSLIVMCFLINSLLLFAGDGMFFAEMQGIYGYRSDTEQAVSYSFMALDAMQKPSMGFDWLQRFSNRERDFAIASLQFRVANNVSEKTPFEPQLYNAWLKYKTTVGDFTLGHLKPASGLSYSLDNHALILPDLSMYNMTYDRDWGGQYSYDTTWGNLSASLTNASGMNLYNRDGNYLLAARIAYGVLNDDNYSIGLTAQKGVNLVAMGYHFHKIPEQENPKLHPQKMIAIDSQVRYNNLESAIDVYAGEFLYADTYSILWRNGINLFQEDKLKLEGQGVWRLFEGKRYVDYAAGVTFQLNSDLAFRTMYLWQDKTNGEDSYKLIAQIYYYRQLF